MTSQDEDMTTVLDHRIAHANKVVTLHNGFETPTTLVFLGSKDDQNMNISQKHKQLFKEILKIDENAKFKDSEGKEYTNHTDIPDGTRYSDAFPIDDSDKKLGNIYIKCDLISKFNLYDLKYGPMNIMDYIKTNRIFLKFRKFKTTREATTGLLQSGHPNATLRS